jgi:hypothetical protein
MFLCYFVAYGGVLTGENGTLSFPANQSEKYPNNKKILFKAQLFDLEVKGQSPTNIITIHDTPPYDHAPTCHISFTYLKRQNVMGVEGYLQERMVH